MMETLQRSSRAGWQPEEASRLFSAVRNANQQGAPLRSVFEQMAVELGRKPNSIRNYYYAQVRTQPEAGLNRAAPFETFTSEAVEQLLRGVLVARGQGKSVRAAVMEMAGGDRQGMLRLQNKYRAILKNKPHLIEQTARQLRAEGLPCPEDAVLLPRERPAAPSSEALMERAQALSGQLNDPAVSAMLEGLNRLLDRAVRNEEPRQALDRLEVRYDLARLGWEDQWNQLSQETAKLLTLCRDFLALPVEQRHGQLESFSQAVAMALPTAEQALEGVH